LLVRKWKFLIAEKRKHEHLWGKNFENISVMVDHTPWRTPRILDSTADSRASFCTDKQFKQYQNAPFISKISRPEVFKKFDGTHCH